MSELDSLRSQPSSSDLKPDPLDSHGSNPSHEISDGSLDAVAGGRTVIERKLEVATHYVICPSCKHLNVIPHEDYREGIACERCRKPLPVDE